MNAKEEFLKHIGDRKVKCALLYTELEWNEEYTHKNTKDYSLLTNFVEWQYTNFLNSIDFNYNSGYGGQVLFGTIWYIDGTWSSRGEYDGSEWWEYNKCPNIPEELL